MVFQHGTKARGYLHGINASGFLSEIAVDSTIEAAGTTVLTSAGEEYIAGMRDATAAPDGFFDGVTGADTTSFSYWCESLLQVADRCLTFYPQGDTFAIAGYGVCGVLTKHSIKTAKNGAGRATLEMQAAYGAERGLSHHILQAESAANNSTNIDNTTSSTTGGFGVLQVTGVTGGSSPSVRVRIQHSPDNSAWSDLITFTDATAPTAQRLAVSGTVNRHTRSIWTFPTGTTPGATFSVLFGRK